MDNNYGSLFIVSTPIGNLDDITLPYYAMLRAVTFPLFGLTAKFLGFVVMAAGIAIFVALPYLNQLKHLQNCLYLLKHLFVNN